MLYPQVFHTLQAIILFILLLVALYVLFFFARQEFRTNHKTEKLVLRLSPILEARNKTNGIRVSAMFYTGLNGDDIERFVNSTDYNIPDFFLDGILMEDPVMAPNQYLVRTTSGNFYITSEKEFDEEFDLLNWRTSEREGAMTHYVPKKATTVRAEFPQDVNSIVFDQEKVTAYEDMLMDKQEVFDDLHNAHRDAARKTNTDK